MTEFVEGKPCMRGHTKKYKKNYECVECASLRAKRSDAKKGQQVDHWSLTFTKVIVPDVTGIFWNRRS